MSTITNMQRDFDSLISDITNRASLGQQEATGFYAVHCPVCQKMDKKTGGFKFDGDKIVYNCFRGSCDASTVYELGKPVSRKFKRLMAAIPVQIPMSILTIRNNYQRLVDSLDSDIYTKHSYNNIDIPDGFVPFDEGKPHYKEFWSKYMTERCAHYMDTLISNDGKYRGSMAIPMSLHGNLIGIQVLTYQGVYVMIGGGNSHILYAPDGYIPENVIVVEGTMDAKCFPNTVAVMKSKVSAEQAYALRGKNVILLPDRSGNHFIEQYKTYGWSVCIPPWKEKDLNEAVQKYGVMVVARMIKENTFKDPLKIELAWRQWHE